MLKTKRLFVIPTILFAITTLAQQPAATSAVATVEVKASETEAEVGIDKGSTTAPGQ
jgi:hypothetical protein